MADTVSEPYKHLQRLFKEAGCPTTAPKNGAAQDWAASWLTSQLEQCPDLQVPWLTDASKQHLPVGSLVRFRGMVQDASDPQYYHGALQLQSGDWVTTKYGDTVPADATVINSHIWERRPLYCVPVPGSTHWTQPSPAAWRSKGSHATKQTESTDVDTQRDQQQVAGQLAAQGGLPTCHTNDVAPAASQYHPEDCIVHVYDAADDIALHDVIEVVGVLSNTPDVPCWGLGASDDVCEDCEAACKTECEHTGRDHKDEPEQPTQHQVMCVHAILVTRNPTLFPTSSLPASTSALSSEQMTSARNTVVQLLSTCLGGDQLAAEHLLLACLSRVTSRAHGQGVAGMMSLNLTRCPGATQQAVAGLGQNSSRLGTALHTALSAILPLCAYVPLSVDSCSSQGGWLPRRDPEAMRISRSPLQLPRGCMLLLDEVPLHEGKLNEAGIRSLQALQSIITDQVLPYDFEFYSQPFPVELPCVVLSEARSLLHSVLQLSLPLCPTDSLMSQDQVQAAVQSMEQSVMESTRAYLQQTAQGEGFTLTDEVTTELQNEFVAARKADSKFTAEAFQLQLTMARLIERSWGGSRPFKDCWRDAKAMEAGRKARQ